jgi:hypothetical protein
MNEFKHHHFKPIHAIAAILVVSSLACGARTPAARPPTARPPAASPTKSEPPPVQETAPSATPEPQILEATAVPGTFPDFLAFAGEIDQALRDGDASFFTKRLSISVWNCLGDEVYGACQGQPSGAVFEGLQVTEEWQTFTFLSPTDYEATWEEPFRQGLPLRLHAVAHKYGDNPLMPLAAEAFLAVVADETTASESGWPQVRVLFYEYRDEAYWLQGELRTASQAQDWLRGECATCYDQWTAWPP